MPWQNKAVLKDGLKGFRQVPLESAPLVSVEALPPLRKKLVDHYLLSEVALVELSALRLADTIKSGPVQAVTFLIGRGYKGAVAMACARQLANAGWQIGVTCSREQSQMHGIPGYFLDLLERQRIPVVFSAAALPDGDAMLVDGLVGPLQNGPLSDPERQLVHQANETDRERIAIDVPSGVMQGDTVFNADLTVSMGYCLETTQPETPPYGTVILANIALPAELVPTSIFKREDFVILTPEHRP